MSIRSFLARWTTRAAAVAALVCGGPAAPAADVTVPPKAVVGAAPVTVGEPGCASCQSGQQGATLGTCSKCNKSLILGAMHSHKNSKAPYPVTLCPGACFGYFQTQWRKWDDACPYPYLGTGVSDSPRPPAGVLNPRPTGSDLAPPRPLDPKVMPDPKKPAGDLPGIPPVPNKFGP